MKAVPTEEEAVAIAVALMRYRTSQPGMRPAKTPSRWRDVARREGVTATVPAAWRG